MLPHSFLVFRQRTGLICCLTLSSFLFPLKAGHRPAHHHLRSTPSRSPRNPRPAKSWCGPAIRAGARPPLHHAKPVRPEPPLRLRHRSRQQPSPRLTWKQDSATGSRLNLTPLGGGGGGGGETPASVESISAGDHQRARPAQRARRSHAERNRHHPHTPQRAAAASSRLHVRGFSGGNSVMTLYDGTGSIRRRGTLLPFDTWSAERIGTCCGPASVPCTARAQSAASSM